MSECVQHLYHHKLVLKHTDTCMQVRGKREFVGFCVNGESGCWFLPEWMKKVEIGDSGRVVIIVFYLFLTAHQ